MSTMRLLVTAATLAALVSIFITTGATRAQGIPQLAVDAIAEGNTPRSIGAIDNCVEAVPGEEVTIDVIVSDPGLGAAGLSGFEFRLYFDPQVLWVQAENPRMLLSQAPGSSLFPISSQLPNDVGEYLSVAVDFGRSGVEPVGSSEATGGVISRITLKAQGNGESNLRLQRASLVNDNDGKVTPSIAEPARIVVGGKCPAATAAPTTAPTTPPANSGTDPAARPAGGTSSSNTGSQVAGATGGGNAGGSQSVPVPGDVPTGGGPPGVSGQTLPLTAIAGAALAMAGLAAIGRAAFATGSTRGRERRVWESSRNNEY